MRPDSVRFGNRILAVALFAITAPLAATPAPAQTSDLSSTRSRAEAQHEIVMLLIQKKEFTKAAEEANKIFQMKWPVGEEPVLLKELLGFSDQFRHHGQPAIAVQLLDANMNMFKTPASKVAIWKDNGYLMEAMGNHDKAIDCFREALRFEKKSPLP